MDRPLGSRAAARRLVLHLLGPAASLAARRPRTRLATDRDGPPPRPPRILLIRPDHLGDLLLATPSGRLLRAALPAARIDWLVGPWAAEVVDRAPHADTIMTCDFPGFARRPKSSAAEPYRILLREARRLRRRRYDLALVLRPDHWWGALLAALAGIPDRLGGDLPETRPFLSRSLTGQDCLHSVDQGLALARLAAVLAGAPIPPTEPEPAFCITASERVWADVVVAGTGHPDSAVVTVHPGSGAAVKNWPPGRWRAVVAAIGRAPPHRLILTGGASEEPLLRQIAAGLEPAPTVLAGATTLGQLAALFERSNVVAGGDSGPLHLATTVGTPTVRLYGPTAPERFGPRGDLTLHRVLSASLPCQPCGNLTAPPCGARATPPCLFAVSPADVAAQISALLGRGFVPSPSGRGS